MASDMQTSSGGLMWIFSNRCRSDLGRHVLRSPARLDQSSRAQLNVILESFLESSVMSEDEIQRIRNFFAVLPLHIDVSQEVDRRHGLNIIQWLVVREAHELLDDILWNRRSKSNLNTHTNAPLHLACRNGNVDTVRVLLRNKANPHLKSTCCCPGETDNMVIISHGNTSRKARYAISDFLTPKQVVLLYDQDTVLDELLSYKGMKEPIDTTYILHEACRDGALGCIRLLAQKFPEQVHETLPSGENALMISLKKNDSVIQTLLDCTLGLPGMRDMLLDCTGRGDSVLHVVYASSVCLNPLPITKLVEHHLPLEGLVNRRDREGNTPLQVLCRFTGRQTWHRERQDFRNDQLLKCIQYLLEKGTKPESENHKGETCLHLLFEDNTPLHLDNRHSLSQVSILREIFKVLELLLELYPSLDINQCSSHLSPVLNRVVKILCSLGVGELTDAGSRVIEVIALLCKHSAKASIPDEKGIYVLTRILTATNRWFNRCSNNPQLVDDAFNVTLKTVKLLVSTDSDIPQEILQLAVKQIAIMTNISFADKSIFTNMRKLLLLIFNSGLDPNYLGQTPAVDSNDYNSNADNVIYFMARSFIINKFDEDALAKFYLFFHENMTQDRSRRLKNHICDVLLRDFSGSCYSNTGAVLSVLEQMHQQSPSLSRLCRNVINHSLSWKLKAKVPCLPLPMQMKQCLFCHDLVCIPPEVHNCINS